MTNSWSSSRDLDLCSSSRVTSWLPSQINDILRDQSIVCLRRNWKPNLVSIQECIDLASSSEVWTNKLRMFCTNTRTITTVFGLFKSICLHLHRFQGELKTGASPDWMVTTVWHWHWKAAEWIHFEFIRMQREDCPLNLRCLEEHRRRFRSWEKGLTSDALRTLQQNQAWLKSMATCFQFEVFHANTLKKIYGFQILVNTMSDEQF